MADRNRSEPNSENEAMNTSASVDDMSDDDMDFASLDGDDDNVAMAPPLNIGNMIPLGPFVTPFIPAGPHRPQSQVSFSGLVFRAGGRFIKAYRVLSVRHLEEKGHQNLETGGKVVLPPSTLQQLSRTNDDLASPIMFRATVPGTQKATHCGVLEFIAEEDMCYMPSWMMEMLGLVDHDRIQLERVQLPIATFAKFQPQSVDFLEISNPKAILENTLRLFACLTKGDVISFYYNERIYKLLVLETLPGNAVNIIECDMNVDFAPPVGYVSPTASRQEGETTGSDGQAGFVAFGGSGNRLNGKDVAPNPETQRKPGSVRGAPDTSWKIGQLRFTPRKLANQVDDTPQEQGGSQKFTAFGGPGLSLKSSKNK